MYLRLDAHLQEIQSGNVSQITVQPLLNDIPQKSLGGSETLQIHSGDTLKTCFGDAVVTSIILYRGKLKFTELCDPILESWAQREGFSSFEDADRYFSGKYGSEWVNQDMMSVTFRGSWVQDD